MRGLRGSAGELMTITLREGQGHAAVSRVCGTSGGGGGGGCKGGGGETDNPVHKRRNTQVVIYITNSVDIFPRPFTT